MFKIKTLKVIEFCPDVAPMDEEEIEALNRAIAESGISIGDDADAVLVSKDAMISLLKSAPAYCRGPTTNLRDILKEVEKVKNGIKFSLVL